MSERALRGTRLVVTSYETDRGIDLAPRQAVEYACEKGHRFEMPFSVEAEIPPEWECKVCGAQALLVDGDGPEEKKAKPARTHWDMLMERRTREELEEVLEERLAVLRSGAMNIAVHPGTAASPRSPNAAWTYQVTRTTAGAVRLQDVRRPRFRVPVFGRERVPVPCGEGVCPCRVQAKGPSAERPGRSRRRWFSRSAAAAAPAGHPRARPG